MADHVEVNDTDAALAAAAVLSRLQAEVGVESRPPTPDFGGDKYGVAMRDTYPEDWGDEIVEAKGQLGAVIAECGAGAVTAVSEVTGEDHVNAVQFANLSFEAPDLPDSP